MDHTLQCFKRGAMLVFQVLTVLVWRSGAVIHAAGQGERHRHIVEDRWVVGGLGGGRWSGLGASKLEGLKQFIFDKT